MAKKIVGNYRHGGCGTSEYNIWVSMIQRCTNPKDQAYDRYGGRGIKVCDAWMSFETFLSDMGPRPNKRMSLERIDNDKGYEPGNVRWAAAAEQSKNTRRNVTLTFRGRTMILKDWAREVGLPNQTLWNRVVTLGWGAERALTTPMREMKRGDGRGEKVVYQGRAMALKDVALEAGVNYKALWQRVRGRGMTTEEALAKPFRKSPSR